MPIKIFGIDEAPADLDLTDQREAILNVVGGKKRSTLYVIFSSLTLPENDIPVNALPVGQLEFLPTDDPPGGDEFDIYHIGLIRIFGRLRNNYTYYQVLYEYDFDGWSLRNPRAIVAFEAQEGPNHHGGGMELAPDGRIILSIGDFLAFGGQGRRAPQEDASYVGKIVLIDPDTGEFEVAAKGVRNVQHIQVTRSGNKQGLAFGDIGGVTAEELNFISMEDLLDTSQIENFGWGCDIAGSDGNCDFSNPDIRSREGTIYVDQGAFFTGGEPRERTELGEAPTPEPGFRQPRAQFGRATPTTLEAITGPAVTSQGFSSIKAIFGSLSNGFVVAITEALEDTGLTDVFEVNLVDSNMNPIPGNTLHGLNNGNRVDSRYFVFPDGRAGVLLERTGKFYVLTEVDDMDEQ